jgi:hypothetical protein
MIIEGTDPHTIENILGEQQIGVLLAFATAGVVDVSLVGGGAGGVFSAVVTFVQTPAATSAWPALAGMALKVFFGQTSAQMEEQFFAYKTAHPTLILVAQARACAGDGATWAMLCAMIPTPG